MNLSVREYFNKKRIFITGAAGFIGSHLVDSILQYGVSEVIALDNLVCGKWSNIRTRDSRLRLLEIDFSKESESSLKKILNGTDIIFHLAAAKHNSSLNSPEILTDVNITGTRRLAEAALEAGVNRIIFTSSLYAYGSMSLPPMKETDIPKPSTLYGISKFEGEQIIKKSIERYEHASYGILRLFFVYGPRQLAGMGYKSVILANFERICRGEQPVIFGDGKQALDYVYIDDVIDAIIKTAMHNGNVDAVNIGSGNAINIIALTEKMLHISGSKLKPVFGPPDWTAGSTRVSDPSMANNILGWRAVTTVDRGLTKVYKWITENGK